jgi:hypothetical protein
MQVPRYNAALLADGRVLMVGGSDGFGRAVASGELFDPKSGKFAATQLMTTTRLDPSVTLLHDGRVLIAGGRDNTTTPQTSAELFDPVSGTFTTTGSMTFARAGAVSLLLDNGDVLVLGGRDPTGAAIGVAELYNPKSGKFSQTGSLMQARTAFGAVELSDGRVLVVGGCCTAAGLPFTSAEIYDPAVGAFRSIGSMSIGRRSPALVRLPDDRIFIAGGDMADLDTVSEPTSSIEVFDPLTLSFTEIGALRAARAGAVAVVLPDSNVLIVGGAIDRSAEIYDPSPKYDLMKGDSFATGPMTANRYGTPSVVTLQDGRVFVAGGGLGPDAKSADLYRP